MSQMKVLSPQDKELLESMVKAHYRKMLGFACKILRSESEAEDAVQNAFLAMANHMDKLHGLTSSQQLCYLIRTVRNFAFMVLRAERHFSRENRIEELDEYLEDENAKLPERAYIRQEEAIELKRAVGRLDKKYYDVISLYYLHECSLDEISLLLGRKRGTIETQLKRARKYLLEEMKAEMALYRS